MFEGSHAYPVEEPFEQPFINFGKDKSTRHKIGFRDRILLLLQNINLMPDYQEFAFRTGKIVTNNNDI